MKTLAALALALVAGCSTHDRLLAPDPMVRDVSPEKPDAAPIGTDPVCGRMMQRNSGESYWHTWYQGAEYVFDSEECKRRFEEDPDAYAEVVR